MIQADTKIKELSRVGVSTARLLKRIGIESAQDLLFYLPYRYDDFSLDQEIAALQPGQTANVCGTIELIQNRRSFKRRMYLTEALISDGSEILKVLWFNQPFLARSLKAGDQISLAGKVEEQHGQTIMISPNYEKISSLGPLHTKGLVPNYHLTEGLTNKQLRFLIHQVIGLADKVGDALPAEIARKLGLISLDKALKIIHKPQSLKDIEAARKRLSFTEIFLNQIKAQIIKAKLKSRRAIPIVFKKEETRHFVSALPFALTDGQKAAAWEILQDLEKKAPMSRLLEGDVGSGKTLVAILAMLNVALNGHQAALMVPTDILARQHFNSISKMLAAWPIKIGLLTRTSRLKDYNDCQIIIGTHALIQEKIRFRSLALAVVDEQHRFGVKQRQKILDFNGAEDKTPHFLSMTATPIPRSLALAIYGDLDLSLINSLPVGRKKIITSVVSEKRRTAAYDFIRREIKAGRQAFVVCPLIDESDRLGVKSVKAEHAKLDKEIYPDLPVGLLHGKLKTEEKEKIMSAFLDNKIKILVSTSVIEVGVDVPNATIMIIEGAERFGLAQLHQFRGRVGRGENQSYCLLFASNEESVNNKTMERLNALAKYNDGTTLAKIDLKLRGAGEIYGLEQSGFPEIQLASLFDYELIKRAQTEAAKIIQEDADLKKYPQIRQKLKTTDESIHLE